MDPNPPPTSTSTEEDQNSKTTIDQTDQPASDMGSGRSYECVFCKRGFTTAQALGGHMNIHRKDRVKTKPNTTNPSKPEPFNHHSALRPTTTTTLISTSHHQSFQTYFPTSSTWCLGSTTTTTTPPHDHQLSYVHSSNNVNDNTRISNAFKENLTSISLALRSSALDLVDRRDKRSDGNEDDDDDDDNDEELDLELRLGHDR